MRCTAGPTGDQCHYESMYVIIYGCFQQHIRERPMCAEHADQWLKRFGAHKWSCTDCDTKQYIEEIHLVLASEVKVEWLNI